MIPNAFITTLKNSLTEGGNETEVFVNDIKTQDGDTIDISDFAKLGNVGYLIIDNGTSRAEYIKFTGIDTVNKKFTGITRGLSFRANNDNRVNANVKFHPAGASVEIVNNTHYLNHFVDKNSNETINGVKTFTSIPVLPAQNPTSDNEAARKAYVDAAVSGNVGSASESTAGKVKLDKPSISDPRVFAVIAHQQPTPNMTLYVEPFSISSTISVIDFAGGSSQTFSAPTNNPRIDLLVFDTTTSQLAIRQGAESANPQNPQPNSGDYIICSVYHRVGETSIKDKDDGVNGYILKHYLGSVYEVNRIVKSFGDETINGIKTFTSIPILPNQNPTNNNEAARKLYVDRVLKFTPKIISYYNLSSYQYSRLATCRVGDSRDIILLIRNNNSATNDQITRFSRNNITDVIGFVHKYTSLTSGQVNQFRPGLVLVGNYIYRTIIVSNTLRVYRYDINNPSSETQMSFSGEQPTVSLYTGVPMFTDGTYIYMGDDTNPIYYWRKYSISGTTLVHVQNISTNFGGSVSYCDGTYFYTIPNVSTYTISFEKRRLSDFQLVNTYTYSSPFTIETNNFAAGVVHNTDDTLLAIILNYSENKIYTFPVPKE